jgi:hypothetical protein
MTRWAVCGALLLAILSGTVQPSAAQGTAQERVIAAKQLLTAMGSEKTYALTLRIMMGEMGKLFKQKNPAKSQEIDEVFALMTDKFVARRNELMDRIAPLYAGKFSLDELTEILAFYKSDVGAKFIGAQSELIQPSVAIGKDWATQIAKEIEAEMRDELKKRGIDL